MTAFVNVHQLLCQSQLTYYQEEISHSTTFLENTILQIHLPKINKLQGTYGIIWYIAT